MSKKISVFTSIILSILFLLPLCAFSKDNEDDKSASSDAVEAVYSPHAASLLLIDADNGNALYSENSKEVFDPGSLVKIMTAVIALEGTKDLNTLTKVPPKAIENYDYSNGNIGLIAGEELSWKNLISAMLVYDAGDCAQALAHTIGESYHTFIKAMNQKAASLGAKSTKFTDPDGTGDKNQSTLEDMAIITQYAMKNSTFAEIVKMQKLEIDPTNKYKNKRILFNTNKFLSRYYSEKYYNQSVTGIKGSINSDEECALIASYFDGKNNLLCLCAGSDFDKDSNYAYEDIQYLIDLGTDYYTKVTAIAANEIITEAKVPNGKNEQRVLLVADKTLKIKLPKDYKQSEIVREIKLADEIKAPIEQGDILGTLVIKYHGEICGKVNLCADSTIEKSTIRYIFSMIVSLISPPVIILLVLMFLIFFMIRTYNINKRKKK